jgi:uncharacterized protein (DUF1330 family)
MNHVTATPEAIESVRRRDPEQPVEMINLLKFADRADPALGLGDLSGSACYFDNYLAGASGVASALGTGASVVYANDVSSCFLATVGEDWDYMLVVRYPSRRAFLGLVTSDEYTEVAGFRTGSLVNSRLIECVGTEPDGYPRSLHAPKPVDPLLEGPGLFRDERVNAVFDRDQAQPTDMLNLIRLAEITRRGGGVDGLSGAEGYEIYRTGVATEYAERAGVEITWRTFPVATLIGPEEECWDQALIYHYDSRAQMMSMFRDRDDYLVNHLPRRNASIVDSRLIETTADEG